MYLSENYLLDSAPQHDSLDFSRGQLEDITVEIILLCQLLKQMETLNYSIQY